MTDSVCLAIELLKSINEIILYNNSKYYLFAVNNLNCKLLDFITASFHLASAWLICAFSIERCIAVIWPFLVRKILNIVKTRSVCMSIFVTSILMQTLRLFLIKSTCLNKNSALNQTDYKSNITCLVYKLNQDLKSYYNYFILNKKLAFYSSNLNAYDSSNCLSRCKCVIVQNEYGEFLLKFHSYFHQLTCLVLIPSIIVITCNSLVFYKIIQRRRMIKSGKFHEFQINKQSKRTPTIKISRHNSTEPELNATKSNNNGFINMSKNVGQLNEIKKVDAESLNSGLATYDDEFLSLSTTYDESKSIDSKHLSVSRVKKTKQYIQRAKLNSDIKLALLMMFSASFLVLVLPEALLNIYKYHHFSSMFNENLFNSENLFSFKSIYLNKKSLNPTQSNIFKNICDKYYFDKLHSLLDIFLILKLMNYSSNFLAYLTLTKFGKVKLKKFCKSSG